MKEIGEILKEGREQNGVSIEEASEDLNYKVSQLEAIESGDFKLFKDIFLLKCMIMDYSKYLGLDTYSSCVCEIHLSNHVLYNV